MEQVNKLSYADAVQNIRLAGSVNNNKENGLLEKNNLSSTPIDKNNECFGKIDLSKIPITDIPLPIRQSHTKNACHAILFTDLEIQRSEYVPRLVLVAKFSKGRPTLEAIRSFINNQWGLSVTPIVGLLDARHVTTRFSNEEDMNKAWIRSQREMNGALFRLFKWSRDFSLQFEPAVAPIWIRLPLLPLNFCVKSYLKAITYPIGKFLAAGIPTLTLARPAYARVCVELDLRDKRETKLWIGRTLEDGFWQSIIYEKTPKFCNNCLLQGHDEYECRKGYKGMGKHVQEDIAMMQKQRALPRKTVEQRPTSKHTQNHVWMEKDKLGKDSDMVNTMESVPTGREGLIVVISDVQKELQVPGEVCNNTEKDKEMGRIKGQEDESAVAEIIAPIKECNKFFLNMEVDNQQTQISVTHDQLGDVPNRTPQAQKTTEVNQTMWMLSQKVQEVVNKEGDNAPNKVTETGKEGQPVDVLNSFACLSDSMTQDNLNEEGPDDIEEVRTEAMMDNEVSGSAKKKKRKKKKKKTKEAPKVENVNPYLSETVHFSGSMRDIVGDYNLDSYSQVNYGESSDSDNYSVQSVYEGKAAEKYMSKKQKNDLPFHMVTRGIRVPVNFK